MKKMRITATLIIIIIVTLFLASILVSVLQPGKIKTQEIAGGLRYRTCPKWRCDVVIPEWSCLTDTATIVRCSETNPGDCIKTGTCSSYSYICSCTNPGECTQVGTCLSPEE